MKNLNKLFLLAFLLIFKNVSAQDIPGFDNSNYAGISGVNLQPACIADMRYKVDITLVGVGFSFNNNYIGINTPSLLNGSFITSSDVRKDFLKENTNPENKSLGIQETVQFPSIAVSITNKISVGLSIRERGFVNLTDLTPTLAHILYTGVSNDDALNKNDYFTHTFNNDGFNIGEMTWMEYGIHYAQVIKDNGTTFLKVGGTLKFVNGLEGGYLYANNLTYNFKNSDYLTLNNSHFGYGHTDNISAVVNSKTPIDAILKAATNLSPAVDVGAVFEWRPDYDKFTYLSNKKIKTERKDQDKYRLRIGVSILDIGGVQFIKGNATHDFIADTVNWKVGGTKLGKNPILGVDSVISRTFPKKTANKSDFVFGLPTTFSVQADFNFISHFYVNLTTYSSPRWLNVESQASNVSYYSITPRWDTKWFGAFLPISINEYGQANVGAAFRVGPLVIGSSQIISFLASQTAYGMDVYAAIKIPIFYGKPKPKDICPNPGTPPNKN